MNKRLTALLLFGCLFSLSAYKLSAQSPIYLPRPGDYLTLKVAVIGPGDELYFWWGHIGLVVEDRRSGEARFFDWGVFSFDNENFFTNFAFGRLIYSCMVSPADWSYGVYIRTNRDVILYTLDLPPERKEAVMRFAEINMLPENRDYNYHHFQDNCATRIRDIIDLAVEGQFKAKYADEPSRFTLRQHVRRHTWFNPLIDWSLNFWMGQNIDRPLTVWEDMFLPSEIGMRIAEFSYAAADGAERPLVNNVERYHQAQGRPPVLDIPRLQWPRTLLVSFLFSSIIVILCVYICLYDRKHPGTKPRFRVFFGITQGFLGLFFGIAGSALFFLQFFTDHDYTYDNINILFVNPILLILIPLGLLIAFSANEKKRHRAARFSRVFWIYVLAAGFLTMLIKLFPGFFQQNQVDQALVLPIALTMIVILFRFGSFIGSREQ
ncbi:MAG: DUF4105 domain-containing protein [Treponema sp.]|nr:DUF4105 domain-containing protein [Treponema sp.]